MLTILLFVLILSVLVMIHEFGHFIMAKRAGMGVEEFGFGLPPRIWGKKIKGTIYSINWLPFGGFVRLVGEDATDKKVSAPNSFQVKSLKERTYVVLAGVTMNLIVAVFLFYIILFALGFKTKLPLIFDHNFKFVNQSTQVLISDVSPDGPAKQAGMTPGEAVIEANSVKLGEITDLQKVIKDNPDQQIRLLLQNPTNNQTREVTVTPKYNDKTNAPAIGVILGELAVLHYETIPQKIFSGFIHSYNTTEYSLSVFGKLIGYAIANKDISPVSEGVSGPVGIASITKEAVAMGPISVLQLVALLSLNLAIMNVLPIPALDGGRFFFLAFEAITRRKPKPAFEKWVHTVGFVALIGLILVITYNDILKLLR